MRDATEKIIARAEEVSGFPVQVESDPSIQTSSTVRYPRGSLKANLIRFDPQKAPKGPDYLVAYQCGYVIRTFECPSGGRYQFAVAEEGRKEAEKLLYGTKIGTQNPSVVGKIKDQIIDGLMVQLRSVPIGMRIERWIRRDYSSLHDQQETEVRRELDESQQVLSKKVKEMFPPKIYVANVAMNAAYAAFWAQLLDEPPLRVPYKTTRHYKEGMKLLNRWVEIEDVPEKDCELVDTWAEALGLEDWYEWISLDDLQE